MHTHTHRTPHARGAQGLLRALILLGLACVNGHFWKHPEGANRLWSGNPHQHLLRWRSER